MSNNAIQPVFTIINTIATNNPAISEKVRFVSQLYALIKLDDTRVVALRREDYRGVPNALILRDYKSNKIVAKGLKAIIKELEN